MVFDEADLWIDKDTIADKWIMLQVLIEQAWRYSKRLQTRMKSSWENRRKQDKPPTTICPCWLKWCRDRQVFRFNEFAAKLRDACEMAINGHGASEIRKRLEIMHVSNANLTRIFHKPELMGSHRFHVTSHDGKRTAVGKTHHGYYPALLTEVEYHQLQESLESRRTRKGGRGENCTNLFTHLLMNESDGTELMVKKQSTGRHVLLSQSKKNGLSRHPNLHYDIVEKSLLSLFIRLKKTDLQPAPNTPDILAQLGANLRTLQSRRQQYVELQIKHPEKDYSAVLDGLADKIAVAASTLAHEETKHPTRQLLDETQDAIDYMANLEGKQLLDARVKAKNIIRRLVKTIIVDIDGARSCSFAVTMLDGTILTGETSKRGQYQVGMMDVPG